VIVTLSSVGTADIKPHGNLETCYEMFIILMSAILMGGTIGSFGLYYNRNDTSGTPALKARMRRLKEYMKYRSLPQRLQASIVAHFEVLWARQKDMDCAEVLRELSVPLRLDMAMQVNQDVLNTIKVLESCPFYIQRHLAVNFRPHACLETDVIYRGGDLGFEIYFVMTGKLVVLSSDNKVVRDLRSGDYFGTSSVLGQTQRSPTGSVHEMFHFSAGIRTETVQALSKCTFFTLHTKDLVNLHSTTLPLYHPTTLPQPNLPTTPSYHLDPAPSTLNPQENVARAYPEECSELVMHSLVCCIRYYYWL
jgi:hypothetical protein